MKHLKMDVHFGTKLHTHLYSAGLGHLKSLHLDQDKHVKLCAAISKQKHAVPLTEEEIEAIAATHQAQEIENSAATFEGVELQLTEQRLKNQLKPVARLLFGIAVLLFLLLVLFATRAHAQGTTNVQPAPPYQDAVNHAFKVNVVAGGAGGGLAQLQVGEASDGVFVNVGYFSGQLNLPVDCVVGCSGSSFLDNSAFTIGTSVISNVGATFNDSATACVSGNGCVFRSTANRALHINLRNASGTEIGTSSNPVQVTLANTGANTNKLLVTADPITFASAQAVTQSGSWTNTVTQATGSNLHVVVDTAPTTAVTGTFFQTTQPVSIADGSEVTLGAKADAKNAATDSTAVSIMSVLKEISSLEQAPASRAVTNGGTFAVQVTSAPSTAVTNAGTFAVQEATLDGAISSSVLQDNIKQWNAHTAAECGVSGCPAVGGNQADGSALSGQPITMAGKGSGNANIPVVCDNWTPFSLASTTSLKLVSKISAKQVYICSINIVVAAANDVALIEGTKTTTDCDTSAAGMAGGATAATGWNFAANGGLTQGSGVGTIMRTATANHDVCLLASANTQVSGVISWTQF